MTRKILIVEDEMNLLKSLSDYLEGEGFQIFTANSLQTAELKMHASPDVVLLDWMLPDGQGIDLLKKWRHAGINIPVILLTARADLIDKVLGLELGANDYLTKPFEPRELLARIHVQLRQIQPDHHTEATILEISDIRLVISSREVFYQDKKIELTKMEYYLLKLLLENSNQVFSREELLKQVWGYDKSPTTRTVDTHILQLRQKTHPDLFETMHGIGYRFKVKK
jgi:DNA-binding response OmpR family regulator